jgi:hypothetical protein
MSHYAQVINGIVQQVIVADQDFIDTLSDKENWIQTSFNTRYGVHYAPNSTNPDGGIALRANYAGVGFIYDATNDVFYAPKPLDINNIPCDSWTISAPNWKWTPPIPMPKLGRIYNWDETNQVWIEVNP